jgi:hypothetical protein
VVTWSKNRAKPGSNGNSLQHQAALSGERPFRSQVKGKNTGEELGRFGLQAGELALADAGYSNPPAVAAVVAHGVDLCVRLNPAVSAFVD